MTTVRITKKVEDTSGGIVQNPPMEVKTIRAAGYSQEAAAPPPAAEEAAAADVASPASPEAPKAPLTDAERRAQRREEYKQGAMVHNRAVQQLKQAEEKLKSVQELTSLMDQAKENPAVLAKALGMTPEEFSTKMFNKMYNIKEEAPPAKEETFEESTKRRLAEYEAERQAEKERRLEEVRQQSMAHSNSIKHKYIQDNILPAITDQHEFIQRNEKHSCAAYVYDLMNQAFQEHCAQGGDESNFNLKPQDVVDQLEEELEKQAIAQMTEAKNISKLKKYFRDEEAEAALPRKDFSAPQRRTVPSLSNNLGPAAPPSFGSISSGLGSSAPQRKIPLKNKDARREAAKRNLGNG